MGGGVEGDGVGLDGGERGGGGGQGEEVSASDHRVSIAGWTSNPNFPVVGGGVGGTPWTSSHDERACYTGAPVGPLIVPAGGAGPIVNFVPGQPMPMIVWVTR